MTSVVPVVLAAGESLRMGYPKALLPLGQDIFLTRILRVLDSLRLEDACVVLGNHADRIQPSLRGFVVRVFVNPDPARGQISSMRLALEKIAPECPGCLIWPVDQPVITAELVHRLISLFTARAPELVLPCYEGKTGHPAIFGRKLIAELLAAPPGAIAKDIVARYKDRAAWLTVGESGTIEDIDTPGDYLKLTGETLECALARRDQED